MKGRAIFSENIKEKGHDTNHKTVGTAEGYKRLFSSSESLFSCWIPVLLKPRGEVAMLLVPNFSSNNELLAWIEEHFAFGHNFERQTYVIQHVGKTPQKHVISLC